MTDKDKTRVEENPAVETAKEQVTPGVGEPVVLSTGVTVRFRGVSASLIDEVRMRIKDPEVPVIHDEEKDRDLRNPSDPKYLKQLEEAEEARSVAATDAMIMFGVELVDPLPEDDLWIKKLRFMGIEVDEEDPLTLEFAFKKYIAVGVPDLPKMFTASSPVTEEDLAKAMASFQRDKGGGTDTESG